ncbi:hypothetical protein OGX80_21970 [Citrobacter sp. CK194]|uniref:hypothetical protein n=1 Tax=Citrobacter TaxID=544 RepID=UPI001B03C3D7|nr:hypothetical protein [Citrobacter sp. CK194]MDM3027481.1 hypothetical protein [Citrobacter sp. CK194]HBA1402957.1 hypothetical protein [Citrobacter koseri]
MNSFATVSRIYPFRGQKYASVKQPSVAKQTDGFKPTYIDQTGKLIQGDAVDFAELNYIFNDLYAQAAHIDQLLTAKGK